MRRFEMRQGGSRKFWEITPKGRVLTITFGKIGSKGQTQTKELGSPGAAQQTHDRLVADKLKKGYEEVGVGVAAAPGEQRPRGILASLLGLFAWMTTSTPSRSVVTGKVVFPKGGMQKWLAKKIRWRNETVAELVARAAALTARGERFLELTIDGEVLEIRGWDWLEDESLDDTLALALETAAPLQPKGEMKRFSRYRHGGTQWVTWKFVGKKLDIDESDNDDRAFDWDTDGRVRTALGKVAPALERWLEAHPDVRLRIERSGRWGYVDRDGRELIAPTFASADEFHEGLAFVSVGIAETRVIDLEGKLLPGEWQYHQGHFRRGLGAVSRDERYGYIDRTGALAIGYRFARTEPFDGPLAIVSVGQLYDATRRWITPEGELVGDAFQHTHGFTEDRAWVFSDAEKAWGCVDGRGVTVIDPGYYDCRPFAGGLAAVRQSEESPWGYLDARGRVAIPARFDEANAFSEGRAVVKIGKRYRLLDAHGGFVGKPFESVPYPGYSVVSEGMLVVKSGGKAGYLSRDGEVVIEPRFVEAVAFSEGLAVVAARRKRNDKVVVSWGAIDKTGAFVVPPTYDALHPFAEGRAMMQVGGRCGFIDRAGAIVVPPRYKQAQRAFCEGRAWVQLP